MSKIIHSSNLNKEIAAQYGIELEPITISDLDPSGAASSILDLTISIQLFETLRVEEKRLWDIHDDTAAEEITKQIGQLDRKITAAKSRLPNQNDLDLVNNAVKAAQYLIAQTALEIAHKR